MYCYLYLKNLWNNNIPFVFVTNGTYCSATLVGTLTKILGLPFTDDHVVVAPSPCTALTDYHDKRVLVCCQDDSIDLIPELGFSDYILIPQLVEIFPELDYVDHKKRIELLVRKYCIKINITFTFSFYAEEKTCNFLY